MIGILRRLSIFVLCKNSWGIDSKRHFHFKHVKIQKKLDFSQFPHRILPISLSFLLRVLFSNKREFPRRSSQLNPFGFIERHQGIRTFLVGVWGSFVFDGTSRNSSTWKRGAIWKWRKIGVNKAQCDNDSCNYS